MSYNFYLDVFNKLLEFNETEIFIIFDRKSNIWFKLKDLLIALDYNDTKDAIKNLKIDKKYISYLKNIKVGGYDPPTSNIQPKTKMINNNGLFMLLSVSTKPLAKIFMKKYIDDIMPKITSTGSYISSKEDMEKINGLHALDDIYLI